MTDAMERGRCSKPRRYGDVVERVLGPGRPNVYAFLEHLHGRGFEMAPRFLGLTEDGTRERLSFMHGQTGYPPLAPQLRRNPAPATPPANSATS